MTHYERDQARLEEVRTELDDVGAALAHLDDGTYGLCEACGSPIDEGHMAAVPTARYCVNHQLVPPPPGEGAGQPGDGPAE
jgi:RNA polymerase-binding transcription factor DksA